MRSYPQAADHLCGAACVRDILDYYHLRLASEHTLGKSMFARYETGIDPVQIERYLRERGLTAEYLQEKNVPALLRRLQASWLPIVCGNWWDGHYMVLFDYFKDDPDYRLGKGKLLFADPAAVYDGRPDGITVMSVERFKAEWRTPYIQKRHEVVYVRNGNGL